MLAQVEVGTRMDTLHFLESERHLKFDIGSGIGIMGQFLMIVETIIFSTETKSLMPFHTDFLPFREPFHLSTRFNEELHLHLFKLAHTEDELTGYNLITESLAYLSDSKRYLHTACLLYIQVIDKNSLSCLRTQINLICRIGSRTHLCREHQIKLTHVGPVFGTTDRVYDSFIQYNLLEFFQIRSLHSSCITFVQRITFLLMLYHTGIGLTEFSLIERITETFLGLSHFLIYFLFIFGYLILNQVISTITLFRIAVVYQGVVESIHVS